MQRYGLVEVTQQKNGRIAPKVAYKRVELTMELERNVNLQMDIAWKATEPFTLSLFCLNL